MSKRSDNIHKRRDGRWEGRFPKGRGADGALIYGSVYGKSFKEAKEKLLVARNNLPSINMSKAKSITFGDVLGLWMDNNRLRLKGGTIHKYQIVINNHILPELGSLKISDIDTTLINNFLFEKAEKGSLRQQKPLSPAYVKSIMLIINAALKFAVNEELCKPLKNPIHKPVDTPKKLEILSAENQKRLENEIFENSSCNNIGILISLQTGLRIGEICALKWENIDFEKSIIQVRHTIARVINEDTKSGFSSCLIIDSPKTKASLRDIPISKELVMVLKKIRAESVSEFVVSKKKDFVSTRTYEYRFHTLLKRLGIPPINFHALRHTFATRCIEAGVDVKSLSEILGHANVGITLNTYVHSSMELKRIQLKKLSALSA